MRSAMGWVLAALALTGCHSYVVDMPQTEALQPSERIGYDFGKPAPVDGVDRVEVAAVPSQQYTPDQLAKLPVGATCQVRLKASDRIIRGRIRQTDRDILVLDDASERIVSEQEVGVPLPFANRLFRNTGVATQDRHLGTETISAFEIASCFVEGRAASPSPRSPGQRAKSAVSDLPRHSPPQAPPVDVADLADSQQQPENLERLSLSSRRAKSSAPRPAASPETQTTEKTARETPAEPKFVSTVVAETFAVPASSASPPQTADNQTADSQTAEPDATQPAAGGSVADTTWSAVGSGN